MCFSRCLRLALPGPVFCPACVNSVCGNLLSRGFCNVFGMLYSDGGSNLFSPSCWGFCMLWFCFNCGLQQLYKGGHVTLWCPMFLQTEDKVGDIALTESRTCFRLFTDHTTSMYKHIHTTHTEPCTPDTYQKHTTWLSIMNLLLVKESNKK